MSRQRPPRRREPPRLPPGAPLPKDAEEAQPVPLGTHEWGLLVPLGRGGERFHLWLGNGVDEPPSAEALGRLVEAAALTVGGLVRLGWRVEFDAVEAQRMTGLVEGAYQWAGGGRATTLARAMLRTLVERAEAEGGDARE